MDKGRAEGEAKGKAEGLAEGKAIGEARGKAEGLAEGETREKSAIARRMLEDGVPVETVAKYSGLTKEDVLKLA